ncbi:MAG TPA: PBP1A family penicillin-binding protein, partial [Miltoncostaeaceae bacterium]|nr:PBP1A family penicillin-binding protein [Miltoncostaeaceae bacterium]
MSRTRQKRLRRRRHVRAARRRRVGIAAGVAAVGLGTLALGAGVAVHEVGQSLEQRGEELKPIVLGQNTRVFDRDGKLLGVIAGVTNRTQVRAAQLPDVLREATVAIEDKRFYDHDGVDYYRLVGAGVRDIALGEARQGGSTITMQLVKNLYEGGEARTLERKIEEAYLAFQYEKKYTKDQILTRYLNGVFYGNNAVGVQAASLTYFSEPVWRITLPQAALLAGLPQAPSAYDPFRNPDAARQRRNVVLQEMADQGFITQERADQAKRAGLGLRKGDLYTRPRREGYFFEFVRQDLIDRYGERAVQQGGFRVETTIDAQLQADANEAIRTNLNLPEDPAAAIVMIDSRTGYIRAMQSSQSFSRRNQFNFATQALRQPGSTFKTFVLAAAIRDRGMNPYTTSYASKPLNFYDSTWGQIDVSTYSNTYSGRTSVASATLRSDNSVYTQMTLDVGPDAVVRAAYDMGVPRARKLPVVPSVGLGSGEVTPLDMATAYSPLSNGGFRVQPLGIQRIITSGGKRRSVRPQRNRVMSDGVAYEVTRILRDNVSGGTGTRANIAAYVAGKTGTTDNYVDAWFVGYTPCYTTAVWVGYPNNDGVKRSMTNVHGITVAGGTFPTAIWADFMEKVLANPRYACRNEDFPLPQEPVAWSAFSSPYTRSAGEADTAGDAEEIESTESESTESTESAPTTRRRTPSAPRGGRA